MNTLFHFTLRFGRMVSKLRLLDHSFEIANAGSPLEAWRVTRVAEISRSQFFKATPHPG